MAYYICDVDGTVCDITHRLHYIKNGSHDWHSFHMHCDKDEPKWPVINLMKTLRDAGHIVEYWSGRSDIARTETEEWFKKHFGYIPNIKMRRDGDYTPDHILKKSWLDELQFKPDGIFDDRDRVVNMWRDAGIQCYQVNRWTEVDQLGEFVDMIKPLNQEMPMLTLLVGPSGAGKTTFVQGYQYTFLDKYGVRPLIVSSDRLRETLCGDFKDQSRNDDVFKSCHLMIEAAIKGGIPVIFDATNIKNKDRKAAVACCPIFYKVEYIVIDRPLETKLSDGDWRLDVNIKGQNLIQHHHNVFQSNLKDILVGDNISNVTVVDERKI